MQTDKIRFGNGEGRKLAVFPEAVDFDRQMYDVLKAWIGGDACRNIISGATSNELDGEHVEGEDTPLGFEAWGRLHLEHWQRPKESCINHMISPLSVQPARGYEDLRSNIDEVEGHIR